MPQRHVHGSRQSGRRLVDDFKPKNLKGELKPIIAILESEESEEKSVAQIADEIVSALDEVRAKKNQVAIIARVSPDHGKTWKFFVMGPYKSMSIAKQKGESLMTASKYPIRWMRFTMVSDARTFLKELIPPEEPASAWVGEVPMSLVSETIWIEPEESE